MWNGNTLLQDDFTGKKKKLQNASFFIKKDISMLMNINQHWGYAYEYSEMLRGSKKGKKKILNVLQIYIYTMIHLDSDWLEGVYIRYAVT